MFDPGIDRNGLPCARLRPLVLAEDALSRVLQYVMKTSTDQAVLRPKRAFSLPIRIGSRRPNAVDSDGRRRSLFIQSFN
jgi:hypothetical protein